jgi:hypothetical protein
VSECCSLSESGQRRVEKKMSIQLVRLHLLASMSIYKVHGVYLHEIKFVQFIELFDDL